MSDMFAALFVIAIGIIIFLLIIRPSNTVSHAYKNMTMKMIVEKANELSNQTMAVQNQSDKTSLQIKREQQKLQTEFKQNNKLYSVGQDSYAFNAWLKDDFYVVDVDSAKGGKFMIACENSDGSLEFSTNNPNAMSLKRKDRIRVSGPVSVDLKNHLVRQLPQEDQQIGFSVIK